MRARRVSASVTRLGSHPFHPTHTFSGVLAPRRNYFSLCMPQRSSRCRDMWHTASVALRRRPWPWLHTVLTDQVCCCLAVLSPINRPSYRAEHRRAWSKKEKSSTAAKNPRPPKASVLLKNPEIGTKPLESTTVGAVRAGVNVGPCAPGEATSSTVGQTDAPEPGLSEQATLFRRWLTRTPPGAGAAPGGACAGEPPLERETAVRTREL